MNRLNMKTWLYRVAIVFGMTLGVLLPVTVSTAATLNSIAVTPANPTITVGQTQPFMATGTFSDGNHGGLKHRHDFRWGGSHLCCLIWRHGEVLGVEWHRPAGEWYHDQF
jgi:hypothetical protein